LGIPATAHAFIWFNLFFVKRVKGSWRMCCQLQLRVLQCLYANSHHANTDCAVLAVHENCTKSGMPKGLWFPTRVGMHAVHSTARPMAYFPNMSLLAPTLPCHIPLQFSLHSILRCGHVFHGGEKKSHCSRSTQNCRNIRNKFLPAKCITRFFYTLHSVRLFGMIRQKKPRNGGKLGRRK
jgi:hypothetical protein